MKKYIPYWARVLVRLFTHPSRTIRNLYLNGRDYKLRWDMILKAFMNIKTCTVEGDYLEFGCHSARTFKMARNVSRQLGINLHFYAFDSFRGLPEIKGIDQHGAFVESSFSMGRADF